MRKHVKRHVEKHPRLKEFIEGLHLLQDSHFFIFAVLSIIGYVHFRDLFIHFSGSDGAQHTEVIHLIQGRFFV